MPNKNLIDLTGQRFGRLEVLKYNGIRQRYYITGEKQWEQLHYGMVIALN